MTALDACEPQIIRALENEGWEIVEKPLFLHVDHRTVFPDFLARQRDDAGTQTIVVMEVKCFTDPKADLADFYGAVGQYQFYRLALQKNQRDYPLYLAIPSDAYQRFSTQATVIELIEQTRMKLLVVDIIQEVVVAWYH